MTKGLWIAAGLSMAAPAMAQGLDTPDKELKVFQFPADAIPRIDGDLHDWDMVDESYVIDTSQIAADNGSGERPDPKSLKVRVKVGWVKGLNRLYFLYEAEDDWWEFASTGLRNDTFEIVVDGNRSGGPLIARFHPDTAPRTETVRPAQSTGRYISDQDAWFDFQNQHAQNYHIFTPAAGKDWSMAWGPQAQWIKRLPWSNIAYRYNFKPGGSGKLVMEFWVTPFDHAAAEGPEHSVESKLVENKLIGLSWAVIDYDGPDAKQKFWNLSAKHTMYGQASELRAFRLMPLEARLQKGVKADWSFTILDRNLRSVAFHDDSTGGATQWQWDFGDGTSSTEQHPIHRYAKGGSYVVVLKATGPTGTSQLSKVWDVAFGGN